MKPHIVPREILERVLPAMITTAGRRLAKEELLGGLANEPGKYNLHF